VKKLVEKCSESKIDIIRSVDGDGNTPLHLACYHGYEEVALYLINNQADIGARYVGKILFLGVYNCISSIL
jgi:ankyrin repeat protein